MRGPSFGTIRLGLRTAQRVKQWRRRDQGWIVVNDRDRQNLNLVVVRQRKRASARRHDQRVHEEIGILVRLVEPLRCMVVRGVPTQLSLLDITGLQSDVVIWIAPGGRPRLARRINGRPHGVIGGDSPVTVWSVCPDARVPLADPTGPRLNVQLGGAISYTEECLLILLGGCCGQQIDTIELAQT